MIQIYMKYNPYRMETQIDVNGKSIATDSILYKIVKGKRLQEWIGGFPKMLVDELNTRDFDIRFYGMPLDWDDFEDVFQHAKDRGIIRNLSLTFIEGKSDEAVREKIVKVFTDLQEGSVKDFKDPKLTKVFASINNSVFPINVVATMSSGKSTLINALLGKRMMPAKNTACTAKITEILDDDNEQFVAVAYNKDNVAIRDISELTYEIMSELNDDENVHRIAAKGNIPFLDASDTALMLVDTPGPNNSQNQAHKNTTYKIINNDSNNLILYVLNGTQLLTNDDAALLSYVAEQMKKGGKQIRDRFLFVINKMDEFNPDEEDIGKAIKAAKSYLASYGIEEPQIFPCSAVTALNIRTYLNGIDIENLTEDERKKLPSAARKTRNMIDTFIDSDESMHLEQYSTLSPSAQQKLDYQLDRAKEAGDKKEQALIHCGIYSIEAAITAYVKKYAKTKKVKDLVESFQEVLESTQVLVKAKTKVATDEQAAKAAIERAAAVKTKIANGEAAVEFKKKVEELNPLKSIKEKADKLRAEASKKPSRAFELYGDIITNREDAKRLVALFVAFSSDSVAELSSELDSVINQEIIETSEKLLQEYLEKLKKIDEDADVALDFGTADLIKGSLENMRKSVESWCSDDLVIETVDNVGEVTSEEKVYYEKVGQEEEEVFAGTERVKISTKRVKAGSHREKIGTRTVKNPERKGFFGFFKVWKSNYIEEDVYETVDDYKDEDVYDTVAKYKTVIRDIYEERREQIKKFSLETRVLQSGLISRLRREIDEGIGDTLKDAEKQINDIKTWFAEQFAELDQLIRQKYTELEECIRDQKNKEKELEKNRKLLLWIEACKAEIDDILDI